MFFSELREQIKPEILELIKQQRLNCLVEGTRFLRHNTKRKGLFVWRLNSLLGYISFPYMREAYFPLELASGPASSVPACVHNNSKLFDQTFQFWMTLHTVAWVSMVAWATCIFKNRMPDYHRTPRPQYNMYWSQQALIHL